jgi:hypothetical protein
MTEDTKFLIAIALFGLVMLANVITMIRHWRMMRVLNIILNNLIETQAEFNRTMKRGIE